MAIANLNMPPICPTCGKFQPTTAHVCPPKWLVWNADEGETLDDAKTIYAIGADEAVEEWAEDNDHNSAEYGIARGTPALVWVQTEDGHRRQYKVSGEYEPVYWAEPVG